MHASLNLDSLVEAVMNDDLNTVKQCLAAGLNPNDVVWPDDGWTLLHEAVVHQLDIVKELVAHGANINAATQRGYTPLMRASGKHCFEVVKFLVSNAADLTARDYAGQSALDMADAEGAFEIAEYLREIFPGYVKEKYSKSAQYQGRALVIMDGGCLAMVQLCKRSVGGRVHRLDIAFADGSKLDRVELLEECVAVLPSEYAGKPTKTVSVPLDQRG